MRRRTVIAILIAVLIAGAQLLFLARKFPIARSSICPVTLGWYGPFHIGFVQGRHGAWFVRIPENHPYCERAAAANAEELKMTMATELRWIPAKAAGEYVWYLVVVAGLMVLPVRLTIPRIQSATGIALFVAICVLRRLARS